MKDVRADAAVPEPWLEDAIAAQHARGKLTAAERIELLLDAGSFESVDAIGGSGASIISAASSDGLIAGRGAVNGRQIFVHARDFVCHGGAMSKAQAAKLVKLQDEAMQIRAPIVGIFDSEGAEIAEGLGALAGYGEIFRRAACAYGILPQIALIMGPCIGADAFLPALSDFVFMVREEGSLLVSGPDVVQKATSANVSAEDLGGASTHAAVSGMADGVYDNDVDALLQLRRLLDFLPSSSGDAAPDWQSFDDSERIEAALDSLVPSDPSCSYDMKELILKTLDENDFFEIKPTHATNVVTGLGRIAGACIGVLANQPSVLAGAIDSDAARKAARFIRFCDSFNLPILAFVDVPGFLPGTTEEQGRLMAEGASLIRAVACAHIAKVAVVTRNALGAAYLMMAGKPLGADLVYAWPSAQIGLIAGRGAAEIFASDCDEPEELAARLAAYESHALSSAAALQHGAIDAVISPRETRLHIARAFAVLGAKHKDNSSTRWRSP